MSKSKLTFEKAFQRLEEISRELEANTVPLDEALKLFEEGMKLVGDCGQRLDEAEGKIQKLIEQAGGGVSTEPLKN